MPCKSQTNVKPNARIIPKRRYSRQNIFSLKAEVSLDWDTAAVQAAGLSRIGCSSKHWIDLSLLPGVFYPFGAELINKYGSVLSPCTPFSQW